jgi:antitoxin component YwqK of YwqJK toxin-antitoxin module
LKLLSLKYITPVLLLILAMTVFSQENFRAEPEVPGVIRKYVTINRDKDKIAGAKILRCIETRTTLSGTETLSVSTYNKAGKLLQKITYGDPVAGSGNSNFFYLYDNTGKLIQRIDSSSSNVIKSHLEYDNFGGIVKEVLKSGPSVIMEINYEFDAMGRLTESVAKDKLQSCKITEKYVYNTYNDLVKLSINNGCGDSDMKTFTGTFNYKYDKKDRIIEKISIPAAGNPLTETFTYDESGEIAGGYISSSQTSYINYKVMVDRSAGTSIAEINEIENESSKTQYRITKFDKSGNPLEVRNEDDRKNLIYRIDYIYEYER